MVGNRAFRDATIHNADKRKHLRHDCLNLGAVCSRRKQVSLDQQIQKCSDMPAVVTEKYG